MTGVQTCALPISQTREIVAAVQAGAINYLTIPLDAAELELIRRAIPKQRSRQQELHYLEEASGADARIETHNPAMQAVYEKMRMVAPTTSTVLLTGETGVGKGVIARLIHEHSSRADGPFVSVHCGAIPDSLLESELFGHEKGAFTGALRRKPGKFEVADGGTIFLDEIGTISAAAQIKLLRVLQERQFQRVGGEDDLAVDVRIIAATNGDLAAMCATGEFRRDLYYRLNIFPLTIPPLRARPEDIPTLVGAFVDRMNQLHGRQVKGAAPTVLDAFRHYDWPGNIRELENVIERACILERSDRLQLSSLPEDLVGAAVEVPLGADDLDGSLADVRRRALELVEAEYLRHVLTRHHGRIRESAETAGIGVRQLHKLMRKYGLDKAEFKQASG